MPISNHDDALGASNFALAPPASQHSAHGRPHKSTGPGVHRAFNNVRFFREIPLSTLLAPSLENRRGRTAFVPFSCSSPCLPQEILSVTLPGRYASPLRPATKVTEATAAFSSSVGEPEVVIDNSARVISWSWASFGAKHLSMKKDQNLPFGNRVD